MISYPLLLLSLPLAPSYPCLVLGDGSTPQSGSYTVKFPPIVFILPGTSHSLVLLL